MIETINIYEDKDIQVNILKYIHFACLDKSNGVMKILPQYKDALFNLVTGLTQLFYPLKKGKRCPPLYIWSNFPVFAPYCFINFITEPFDVLNDAAQMIIKEPDLSNIDKYNSIIQDIKNHYEEEYPDAFFDIKIFREKYHNVKGYFVFVNDTKSCAMFWGYDDPNDEVMYDSDLFEEEG